MSEQFRYTAELDDEILEAVLPAVSVDAAWLPCTEIANKYSIGQATRTPEGALVYSGKPVWNRVWDIAISDGVYVGPAGSRTMRETDKNTAVEAYILTTAYTGRGQDPPAATVQPPSVGYIARVLNRPVAWVEVWIGAAAQSRFVGGMRGFGFRG
jgi:hypothetical protein